MSSDGHWVVFQSAATDLITNNTSSSTNLHVFARDLTRGQTILLSSDQNGLPLVGRPSGHVISLNSSLVAISGAFDFDGNGIVSSIIVFDFTNKTNALVCRNCANPSLSAIGRWIAYQTTSEGYIASDVFVKDLQTGQEELVSVNLAGTAAGNGMSSSPAMSSDGRFVAFVSKASDLAANDSNGVSDVFLRDRMLGKTRLLSLNATGTRSANGASGRPVMSADGRTVVFQSLATDIAEGDYNGFRDVFVTRIEFPDTDGDGMADEWEMAYFGTLSRDGAWDFDGDGRSDLEEYVAGSDPTDGRSVLRIVGVTASGTSTVTITWSSVMGKTYRVQYKQELNDPWRDLPGLIAATSTVSSKQDTHANILQRFYQVVTVE
jgi:hypothetical protein